VTVALTLSLAVNILNVIVALTQRDCSFNSNPGGKYTQRDCSFELTQRDCSFNSKPDGKYTQRDCSFELTQRDCSFTLSLAVNIHNVIVALS